MIRGRDKISDGKRGSLSCGEEVERDMIARLISNDIDPRVCSSV
jgi:hypothetical protein